MVAIKRVWGPSRKLHRFPQMNTDTWMFRITKKRLTEWVPGDHSGRVAVVAAVKWVTISVTVPTWSETTVV
jgi:hypothetical protein